MRARHIFLMLAAMALPMACGTSAVTTAPSVAVSPTSGPPTEAAPTDAAPPEAAPTDAPSGAPSPAAKLCAVEFEPCPIEAGTYTTEPFSVPFTFSIEGADWVNDRNWPHGGAVTQAASDSFLWAAGVASGQVDEEVVDIAPAVDDFIAHLGRFEGWTLGDPVPVTIDGASGVQVDVTTNDVEARALYLIAEDAFNLSPGEKARFIAVDREGQTVIFVLESYDAATFEAFVSEVGEPLLAGITWD
jgi:hypothetical protein